MKDFKEIFNNARLHFLFFERTKDGVMRCGGNTLDPVTRKTLNFIFTRFGGWEHLSVSNPRMIPTWDMMCFMKNQFWEEDEACCELHPAKKDYVNNQPNCLHIWKPYENEFPLPPRIMVGLTGDESEKELKELFDEYSYKDSDVIKDEYCIFREYDMFGRKRG